MEVNSDHVEFLGKNDGEFESDDGIIDLELEIKVEKLGEKDIIKTEFFEENNDSGALQIIGKKRLNQETSNLVNKKLKKISLCLKN